MAADLLFYRGGELRSALEAQARRLAAEVEAAPEDHLLHVDEDEWATALADRWRVVAPELHAENMWQDPPRETKVDVSRDPMRAVSDRSRPAWYPGYQVTVHIPFSGEEDVFELRASTFSMNPPRAEVRNGELLDVIEYPHDAPVNIRAHAEGLARNVEEHLSWSRSDIEAFDSGLEQTARTAIAARRQRVQANYAHLQETGLPMKRPGHDNPKTYIADAVVRRPAPVLPTTPDTRPMALEPVLGDEVFEHILGIIRSAGRDMERSPGTYDGMGEEDRRQTILLALNTHYRGQTTAEAFNVVGKTDLLVRHEGQNLFVGECKFWSGAKGFLTTVDQLFGYQAWRDTKLAVVMFVRQRDLTSIVEKARDALASHAQFVEWHQAATETELRCVTSWPGDQRRHADLNVFFVHTPET